MNILHLFSDWKWTGPAEPVLALCEELTRRGHQVTFAYRRPPKPVERSIAAFAGQFAVQTTEQFRLNRYFSISDNPRDVLALRRFVRENNVDVVNTHLAHDHLLAAAALTGRWSSRFSVSGRRSKPVLVRTDHKRDSIPASLANRLLFRRTQGVITFSRKAHALFISDFKLPPERVCWVNPAIDTAKFNPDTAARALRKKWRLEENDVAIGVVARFQKYRKTDLFLDAVKRAVQRAPNLKAVLIGRSSQINETVHKPVQQLQLEDNVVVAGYLTDRYVDGLASLDAFVFLIAGSDGTGRALREAMAMGKAVIVNNIGMLPEMIEDGKSGLVFNDTADDLADKMLRITQDHALRQRLGRAALERARAEFSLANQASRVEEFYRKLLSCVRATPE
jgi:glycosyltransferase involved in cell wall biosynthesis